MKLSTAKKNVEILTKMWNLAMDLEEMPIEIGVVLLADVLLHQVLQSR